MRPFARTTGTVMAALTFAAPSWAYDYTLGDLTIAHPMAFETAITAQTGAGYFIITNNGDTDDRLMTARADFPRVEIHEVQRDGDVMKMRQLEAGLLIPAGETVTFEPGGYHVMIMGLPAPFVVGEAFPLTLEFEQAGEVELMMTIEARVAEAMDHSDMNDGDMNMDMEETSE